MPIDWAADAAALGGLFLAAFGAATILPFQSEIVFAGLQATGQWSVASLVVVASIGNTLGSVVNYGMGRAVERYRHRRWFPANDRQMARAQDWYARWGVWSLLLSWAPLGDAITLAAGIMRTPLWLFVLLVGFAKTVRYIVFAWIASGLL
ncbi:YqaA family protein [Sagittula sp. SSi028]|uniref:YqaA family protein n=1 Tax=Sagittula sp. SSi028 TaxID=3400636 RepID=UPI003AF878BB